MKKFLKLFFLISIFLLSGCGIKKADNVLKDLEKKIEDANSYYVEGTMEIMNHEDTYTYDVKVSYQKEDYYRIELTNNLNQHKQVILRNDDGVYVITPSLNKSFKFQSDWPYNNSQVYLLNSIIEDLEEDEDREFKTRENGYYFSSSVNYPNNRSLVKQNIYLDKNGTIEKAEVVDKDDNVQIMMQFKTVEFNKKFDKDYFELSSILDMNTQKKETTSNKTKEESSTENSNSNNSSSTTNQNDTNEESTQNTEENTTKTETTASIEDVVYPMYLPDNTYLTSKESIDTETGERLILTFGGDSSFILVEEVSTQADEGLIIPVSGEFDFLSDVIGVIATNSLSWNSNGIEYYMTSDTLETAELVEIARSISVLPVSK